MLREAPIFKKLATRDIVKMCSNCTVLKFQRGQAIIKAGVTMDKVNYNLDYDSFLKRRHGDFGYFHMLYLKVAHVYEAIKAL